MASTAADLASLNSNHCPRPSSGKFITVYPSDDDQAVALMASLDRATAGLPGPGNSLRPSLSPGWTRPLSLWRLPGPGLHFERRRRGPRHYRARRRIGGGPAHCPFRAAGVGATAHRWYAGKTEPPKTAAEVLLADRFVVRQALRYANKGGVFQATDNRTGQDVVVKQARAHVGGDERGLDARNLLANEAHVLELLQPAGLTPRLVAFFQQEGDSFLAEEPVAGQTLRAWNAAQWEGGVTDGPDALAMARKVAAALALVHQRGVIVRDFTPNNLIIQPDGQLKLIDLELAVPVDGLDGYQADIDPGHRSLTPAYGSPEQAAGLTPALSDDSFALGAILCFLFTGEDPYIDPDSPVAKDEDPVGTWLRQVYGLVLCRRRYCAGWRWPSPTLIPVCARRPPAPASY